MKAQILTLLLLLVSTFSAAAQITDSEKSSADFDFITNVLKGADAYDLGQYELAIKYLEPCAEIASQDTTKEALEDAANLFCFIAYSYFELGEYVKAIEFGTQVLNIFKQVFGESHPDYATSLSDTAVYDSNLVDYPKAVKLDKLALNIRKQELGETLSGYATSLSNFALYYSNLGDYSMAVGLGTQALNILKHVLGESHPDYANSLNGLACYYSYLGDYSKAVELGTRALNIYKQVLGETHPSYAISLSNLAGFYTYLGDYSKAVELGTKAMNIRKQVLGEKHPSYAISLNWLACYYLYLGDYSKAVELGTRALNIRKQVLGEKHPSYANSLSNLAVNYSYLGDYSKAIELGTQALNIHKQVLGATHPDYDTSLCNLACIYSKLGDYSKAVELGTQELNICKQVLGESHPAYANSLNNLACYYSDLGDYSKAVELGTQALNICMQALGETHPDYATSLSNLACYYFRLGDYTKAVELGTQAMNILKQVLGESHPGYATSLSGLAIYYSYLGDYSKAIELGTEALNIRKQVLGESHPDYSNSLSNLALCNYLAGNYGEAYKLLNSSSQHRKEIMLNQFKGATSKERLNFWKENGYVFAYLPMLCLKACAYESVGEVYDNSALFAKGLLLNAETSLRDLILESGDTAAVKQFEAMQMTRTVLNRQYEKPIAERKLNCDSLENVAEQMERELLRSSKAYGDFTRNLTISWKDVQKGLSDGDMAVEFISFPKFRVDTILERGGVQYVALTLKKGYDKPKMITLFEESELDAIPENRWYADTALCHLVWGQLGDELRGVKNVYFSPDGALYNIGIEHLPCSVTENMGERYNMFRLSSTRELAIGREQPSAKSSALYGGLQYYVPPTELLAYNQKKGYSWRTASRDVFEPLPETKTEVENISALLKGHNYDVPAIYAGDEGTEESFKALSGKRTRIIHLATHGCYITPDEADRQRKSDMQQRLAILRVGNDNALGSEEDEALTRSYLAMSGGKMCWTNDTIPEGLDDGLLTAQEISRLDLRGCDLVVLSACETGLGDITSEGVMGLQRGFKKAGVQSIVMSLWKVADRPTQEFMTEFYRHLTAGEGKRASFLAAQRFLKEKYPTNLPNDDGRPPYWASFIILDPEVR
jgi:tetratricopeptide (TPR) repeat protein/CHAT domain-containing protein